MISLSRNSKCHCGSGLKYKKCCLSKDNAKQLASEAISLPGYNEGDDFGGFVDALSELEEHLPPELLEAIQFKNLRQQYFDSGAHKIDHYTFAI